jgi:polyphosphate glucokinase
LFDKPADPRLPGVSLLHPSRPLDCIRTVRAARVALRRSMDVLVIDVGGSHVKLCTTKESPRRFPSGTDLSPTALVERVKSETRNWSYDVISLGLPAVIGRGGADNEPGNLGRGWIRFDFERAFEKPVRLVNDAVMQALGAYDGGRMLFLGLGTGVGSALVTEHVIIPLELGSLPLRDRETIADRLGRHGLSVHGVEVWMADVHEVVRILRAAFVADVIVLGGGNAEMVDPLPDGSRRGGNEDACTGGFRLWDEMVEPLDREPHHVWRVVR